MSDEGNIHLACKNGNVDLVKLLIAKKYDIEACDKHGQRPIHIACGNGNVDIVTLLITEKCDIEARDKDNQRPIHFACANGNVDIVKLLLTRKYDIGAPDNIYRLPIDFACGNGNVGMGKLVMTAKCDIEAHYKYDRGPIHNVNIVKLLMTENCIIEARDKDGQRPIHIACRNGNVEIVKLLLVENCDIEACDKNDQRPIHIACRKGHDDIVGLLISAKCDIDARDKTLKIETASKTECKPLCWHKSCPKSIIPPDSQRNTLVGSGGFGEVHKVSDLQTNVEYAVKSIIIYHGDVKEEVKNLEDDINKYRDMIKHPRIIEYFGSIRFAEKIYIFMEFAPKGSLRDEIRKVESLPHTRIIRYTKQILEGLEFLHDKKIIHRDIKPHNILLDDGDSPKLCDFGLSKALQSITMHSLVYLTERCGTHNYMAPEVMIQAKYSFSADIWSVGATIVHMLTGKPPYTNIIEGRVIMEYEPREPISNNMKSFMGGLLDPDHRMRATATDMLVFLNHHDMIGDSDNNNPKQLE